jgi:hypothetical protein
MRQPCACPSMPRVTTLLRLVVAIDEGALSLIQQITVRAGGVPLYTLLDLPAVYNAMVAQTMPRAVYESDGPAAGLWRHNTKLGADTSVAGSVVGNWSLQQVAGAGSYYWDEPCHRAARTAAGTWQANGRFYSIPLSWLLPIDRYLCLRNLSSFEIEILFQSSIGACCVSTGLGGATPAQVPTQINISEMELRADMVRMSPDYYALFDQEIMAGSGVSYDVDVLQSIPFSIANSSTAPSQRSFQVSQAVRFLKTVSAVTRLQADLNSLGSSKAKFGNHMYAGYAIQVNGVQYPQQPTTKVFDAFQETRKASNMLGSVVGDSIIGYTEWRGPYANTLDPVVAPSRDGTWWGSDPQDAALFIPAVNLETFLTSAQADLQGLNLLEAGGSLVNVLLTNAPSSIDYAANNAAGTLTAAPAQVLVILHYGGVLSIVGGAVSFER